jgi:hypothetical protein
VGVEDWRGVRWVSCVPFCGGRMCDDERWMRERCAYVLGEDLGVCDAGVSG